MRILAITDVHGRVSEVEKLTEKVLEIEPGLILLAGDITHFSGRDSARKVLKPLLTLNVPILAVHGNCDGRDVPVLLEELGIGLHNRRVKFKGTGIVGIGGSNITPFNTVWELTEDEMRAILEKNYHDGDVVLSHTPPKDTRADRVHSGLHVGSLSLREFIEERQPPLVVCGHIHEARSTDKISETVIVNPGPLFKGYYAVIEFDEREKKVRNVELTRL